MKPLLFCCPCAVQILLLDISTCMFHEREENGRGAIRGLFFLHSVDRDQDLYVIYHSFGLHYAAALGFLIFSRVVLCVKEKTMLEKAFCPRVMEVFGFRTRKDD